MLRFAAAAALLAASMPAHGQIRWFDNIEDAKKESLQTGKPIFLEFRCEA